MWFRFASGTAHEPTQEHPHETLKRLRTTASVHAYVEVE
jgi:hypothetical protein